METQDKRRTGATGRARTGGATKPQRRQNSSRTQPRRSTPKRSAPVQQAPQAPREPIPEVHYTRPKPFDKGAFLLKLASLVAVVAALMMCLSLFFRVEQVVVSGTNKYTPWMVKEASGIVDGDSLLSVNDAKVAGKIRRQLPYVQEVRVGIKLPGTVQIEIKELEMTYAIEATDSSWWLIAADGRVIEQIDGSAVSGYTRIIGIRADGPRVEHTVTAEEIHREQVPQETGESIPTLPAAIEVTGAERMEAVLTILQNLESNGIIGQIASLDVSDLKNITMEYGHRLHIVLGTAENLPYKIYYMARAIEQLESYETGELDVSFKFSEQALLNPGD